MSATLGVVAFIVALLTSVMLHEAGHFAFAKRFGMKATEFFVGFGPTIWSFRRGETEYGVKAIPAGGYVKIVGMTPLEDNDPADHRRLFYRQKASQRAVVLGAGSAVHFVIGALLLYVVLVGLGQPVSTTTVASVSACVSSTAADTCPPGAKPSPAKAAGLRAGDKLVAYQGVAVKNWDSLVTKIRKSPAGRVSLTVERAGTRLTLHPVVVTVQRPSLTDPKKTETVGQLGVSPGTARDRAGVLQGVGRTATAFRQTVTGTFSSLAKIPASVPKLFSAERGADSPASVVGIGRISGEVASSHTDWQDKLALFLLIIASLNIFVGIFNLLPLLPLDGGHLAILAFEQARYGVYRVLGRAGPGRVDLTRLLPVAYAVILLFVGLSVLLLTADIVNPIVNPF